MVQRFEALFGQPADQPGDEQEADHESGKRECGETGQQLFEQFSPQELRKTHLPIALREIRSPLAGPAADCSTAVSGWVMIRSGATPSWLVKY